MENCHKVNLPSQTTSFPGQWV